MLLYFSNIPGLRMPVSAIGPSSMILWTKICPAASFIVHPIPLCGSLIKVTRLIPVKIEV